MTAPTQCPANTSDIIILGAGAGGLFCAKTAAEHGKSVRLIDHNDSAGRKLLASGGGKCNFTNIEMDASHYVCENPHFCKSALARFSQWDSIALLAENGISYEERDHGRLFGTESAQKILDLLMGECMSNSCRFNFAHDIQSVSKADDTFCVTTLFNGEEHAFYARNLVVATGSSPWPQLGATNYGHSLARAFGHKIIAVRPALVPLTMPPAWQLHGLSGISQTVRISCGDATFDDELLFTHRGISGPATLQISSRWLPDTPITINFLPQESVSNAITHADNSKMSLRRLLCRTLPERLVLALLIHACTKHAQSTEAERKVYNALNNAATTQNAEAVADALLSCKIAELSRAKQDALDAIFCAHTCTPSGTEGMKKAEAARGGIDTQKVSSRTMESTLVSGLFFIGEVLDVAGELGGYNIHWAWASATAAGLELQNR